MNKNEYIPFLSEIVEVIKHTAIEYTFRMTYTGAVRPGQFFEVSIPKYGEAPISVSGIAEGTIDLTIRRVGKVTDEVFENYVGDTLFLRGPYGNGFDIDTYKNKELVIVAGGTGVSPVRGVADYFSEHPEEVDGLTMLAGFRCQSDMLFREDFERFRKTMNLILTTDVDDGVCSDYNVGLVTEFIPDLKIKDLNTAQAIVVGPPAMMHFSTLALLKAGFKAENIWISYERKMCCGLGKCGHCKIGEAYVCLDGPVFNYTIGSQLID